MNSAQVVNLLIVTGLIAMMLSMGFRVSVAEVLTSIRNVRQVAAGLLANFVLVPAATVALLYLFDTAPLISIGFLTLAVCPGAPVGPLFTALAKGDVPYATGQMVTLAGLSAFLSPALLILAAARLLPASELRIDYLAIVRTLLVVQLLPLAIGLALHHRAPKLAGRLAKPVGAFANLLLLVVVALLVLREATVLGSIQGRGWVGMVLLLAASLAIGWLCGGPGRATRKALAVTTAARNAGVGLVIVSTNFAGTPAMTAVVAYALVSIFGTLGCALLLGAVPMFVSQRLRRAA